MERTISVIVRMQGTIRSLPRANHTLRQPQARTVGFNSAQKLQVVPGREGHVL